MELAEERHRHEQAAQLLSVQWDRMFRALVAWARTMASSVGIANPAMPAEGNSDVAAYLAFFDELLHRLEGASAEFENLIDEASCNLLAVAVDRLFSNIRHLQPDFDFDTVMGPVHDEQSVLLSRSVSSAVNSYIDRFRRSTAKEASKEEGEEEDKDAGDNAFA